MYWGFPEVTAGERLARADSLSAAIIRVSPEDAYSRLHQANPPGSVRLAMLDTRPAYWFRTRRVLSIVYADTGDRVAPVSQALALRVAARWTKQPAQEAHFEGLLRDPDQWTVSGEYNALRPLFKFSWPDGEQVYVSPVSGEVAQYTTREARIAAYFGAIPHWLYWTPLRRNGRAWNKVVVWAAGIGTSVTLLGLIVGVVMYSPGQRYRYRGQPSGVPYSGQKRWHMIFGLLFGLLACAWVFSGLLSMEPFEWLQGNDEPALNVADALRGGVLGLDSFVSKPPSMALEQAGLQTKELEFALFDGQPYYLARRSPQISRIVPVRGGPADQFDPARILTVIRGAVQPTTISESRVITSYDAYYLDRSGEHPLPALLVRMNDSSRSQFYIDLKTAHLIEAYDNRSRWNRWLYHGLHSWNLPWLYRHRPAWDIVVLLLLLGGLSLSVTAVILGFQVLSRLARPARPILNDIRVPTP